MYYKIDLHSSSSCKGTSGLLYIMGSNTTIFCCFKGLAYMSLLHCALSAISLYTVIRHLQAPREKVSH